MLDLREAIGEEMAEFTYAEAVGEDLDMCCWTRVLIIREQTRQRVARFRRIKAGERGFVLADRFCENCHQSFHVLVGGRRAHQRFCCRECAVAAAVRAHRLRMRRRAAA